MGEIHLHSRIWRRKVQEIIYTPEGQTSGYDVPLHLFEDLIACQTMEQAVALIRRNT